MKRGVESCLPTREILTSHHRPPLRFMNWPGESVETPMISFGKDTSQKSTIHQSKDHLIFDFMIRWAIIGHANLFLMKKIEDDR